MGLLAAGLALLGWPAGALGGSATVSIEFGDENVFSPRTARYELLDFNFYFEWGDFGDGGNSLRRHNFVQDDRLFRSGQPTRNGGNLSISVSAGTFPYFCQVHGGPGLEGMSGRLKVAPDHGASEPDGETVSWAVPESETGDRYDVRFKVDDGDWRLWKSRTGARHDVFGRSNDPVNFNGTRDYRIQVRSTLASDSSRRSDWSPTLRIP